MTFIFQVVILLRLIEKGGDLACDPYVDEEPVTSPSSWQGEAIFYSILAPIRQYGQRLC